MSYEPGVADYRILFVCNPHSGGADDETREQIADKLRRMGDLSVLLPSSHEAFAGELQDASQSADIVVVGGGDGTFSDAINALENRLGDHAFGLIPMGTGNDLSRTLGLPDDPVEAAEAILHPRVIEMDVPRATGGDCDQLFVNACVGGLPVAVDEATGPNVKRFLGPLAFWVAGAKGLMDAERFTVAIDGRETKNCLVAGVGNGQTCGGGSMLWPDADLADGSLDSCALAIDGAMAAAEVFKRTRDGSLASSKNSVLGRGERIGIEADPVIEINLDGDLVGLKTPATFEIDTSMRMLVPAF
jgi:YegS/Rv2252/BmrU family lipid kinase